VAINLTKLHVAHFMLRLRTRRLVTALQPLKNVKSPEEFAETTYQILAKCFYREVTPAEPLDRADDCIMLSRALIEMSNFQMAAVALKSAHSELELYVRSSPLKEHSQNVRKMKEQIAAILRIGVWRGMMTDCPSPSIGTKGASRGSCARPVLGTRSNNQ
jgi:hypothetical protein